MIIGYPSTMMDDYQLNLTNIIRHTTRNFPEREVLSRTSGKIHRYTYEDAYLRMMRMGNALKRLGMEPKDRIGVLSWNTHRHFELYFAIPGTGSVLLQMNLRISPMDLTYVVNHSEAKAIFVDETLLEIAETIAPDLKTVRLFVIMTDKKLSAVDTKLNPKYSYEELIAEEKADYHWPIIEEKSAYAACYTTGTTGRPKGVYYSHRSMYLHTLTKSLYTGINCYDSFMQIVPMFHVNGWGDFINATFVGAKLLFPGRYTLEEIGCIVDLMVKERVTMANGAPTIFIPMLEYIRTLENKPDFRGTRFVCGATEPPLSMMKEWKQLTGAEIHHGYGATETSPHVSINFLKPTLKGKLSEEECFELKRKQGIIASGIDLEIVDHSGKKMPHDGKSAGEILVRGPWVAKSYYNDHRTENSFMDGYWKTGDAGTIDPNGYLKVVDRYKDLIKSGGEWISSIDLENKIMAYPNVIEAAVVGLPHPKWEERPIALIVVRREIGNEVRKEEILEFLGRTFSKWQLPEDIKLVDEIPKTSVGKFDKKKIREMYKEEFS